MGKKYYVIWVGRKTGIFTSWEECKLHIEGYNNARYKSFSSLSEAELAYGGKTLSKTLTSSSFIKNSLSVDAACSGNPGVMEYQGVNTETKEVWFHQKYELGTNNIGEFLALVHGLAELKKRNLTIPIYTDSKTAISWIKQKTCKTKLEQSPKTQILFEIVRRAEKWLKTNDFNTTILKWETKEWGEIPADFGRK